MITLAFDTSHYVAVGLATAGRLGPSTTFADARAHVEELIPLAQQVLTVAGIALDEVDEFVVGMGPGPYTGLRVGISAAATLASVSGKPLRRVCSLDAIALQVAEPGEFIVASDARRKEIFWARYQSGNRVGEPQVSRPDRLPAAPVYGDIPSDYRELLNFAAEVSLDAALLAARHAELPEAGQEPYYLRAADASVPGAPKSTLPRLRVRR